MERNDEFPFCSEVRYPVVVRILFTLRNRCCALRNRRWTKRNIAATMRNRCAALRNRRLEAAAGFG